MPDWIRYVSKRLCLSDIDDPTKEKILKELASQIEDLYLQAREGGSSHDEALDFAEQQVGNWDQLSRELRRIEPLSRSVAAGRRIEQLEDEARRRGKAWSVMADVWRDLRQAFSMMAKSPFFAAVAIVSLGIGIGTNTAIYAIYSAIFTMDQGVEAPEALVQVLATRNPSYPQCSYPEYLDYRNRIGEIFSDLMAYSPNLALLDTGERSETILLEEVSGNYFNLLGVEAALGRTFIPEEDDVPGATATAVLNHRSWIHKFNGDPAIVGKTIQLNAGTFTIIGVAPAEFAGMYPFFHVDLWIPLHQRALLETGDGRLAERNYYHFYMKGRLADGVSLDRAQAVLDSISSGLMENHPGTDQERVATVVPSRDVAIGPFVDRPIKWITWLLMGLVGLVLLVACSNLAVILMARASSRKQEIGIRLALGAGRRRLVQTLLTESILLSVLGGLCGLSIARWLIQVLLTSHPPIAIPIHLQVGIGGPSILFAVVLSVLAGVVFGLLPARQASNPGLVHVLKESRTCFTFFPRRFGLRNLLIVTQVAISTVLLLCAGLLLRSLGTMSSMDTGFDIRQGLVFQLPLEYRKYDEPDARRFIEEMKERLAAIPGVATVGIAERLPLNLDRTTNRVRPQGSHQPVPERGITVNCAMVGPDYFRTMGIPILAGRPFDNRDVHESESVAIVNQYFAERYWPGKNPVGKQFHISQGDKVLTIVGVAGDGKYRTLGEAQQPFFYEDLFQKPFHEQILYVIVRTSVDVESIAPTVTNEIRGLDPDMAIFDVRTVSQYRSLMTYIPGLVGTLATALGIVALLLGSIGLYGVISYDVVRRTQEVGIRMALGADRPGILALMLMSGLQMVTAGLGIGLLFATLAFGGLNAILVGVSRFDPISLVGIPLLLIIVALAATLKPALAATRVDPMEALRHS
jgi:predicted permease